MRAIDADALIEKLSIAKDCNDCEHNEEPYCRWKPDVVDICEAINDAPTIEPEQRWIPCSEETGEGFPKEDGRYYVTEQNYGFYLDSDYKKKVAHMSIFKDGDFTDRYYDENHSNITAWCKLPEPYGGD